MVRVEAMYDKNKPLCVAQLLLNQIHGGYDILELFVWKPTGHGHFNDLCTYHLRQDLGWRRSDTNRTVNSIIPLWAPQFPFPNFLDETKRYYLLLVAR